MIDGSFRMPPRRVRLILDHVFSAAFDNCLSKHTLALPVSEHSWGLGEIAVIEVTDGSCSLQTGETVACLDVSIDWENGRQYAINAASLRVEDL